MKDLLLVNWTHRNNVSGGNESRYDYLKQIFPNAELISYVDLFNKGEIKIKDPEKAAKQMDEYYLKRYEENKNILIIREASVGGVIDTSHIPQITMFANPYKSLSDFFKFGREYWKRLIELQKKAEKTFKVATSNFMKEDMKKNGLTPDEIISNPIDIDFFKPGNKKDLRKIYGIPQDKKVGIWVGASDNPIKNVGMISQLVEKLDVFWIMVVKNKGESDNENVKVFHNINKETIRDLYNCADFFILTSPIEGYGMATFEAMACNIPCIISKAGYFWDFWDPRIGFQVQCDDLLDHIGAIEIINKREKNPRQVIIDLGLDLKTWKEKWERLVRR